MLHRDIQDETKQGDFKFLMVLFIFLSSSADLTTKVWLCTYGG